MYFMETLSTSILQVRNSFLEQFKNEQLENISKKLDQLFDVEKDPIKRIVLLASRVETIRKRIEQIYQDENKREKIEEVILATSATIEGQTTAFYIQDSFKGVDVKISKLAQGLPVGGEIESLDDGTLIYAFKNRNSFSKD